MSCSGKVHLKVVFQTKDLVTRLLVHLHTVVPANSKGDALNTFPLFPPLSQQQGASSTPPISSLPQGPTQVLEKS